MRDSPAFTFLVRCCSERVLLAVQDKQATVPAQSKSAANSLLNSRVSPKMRKQTGLSDVGFDLSVLEDNPLGE